MSMDPKTTEMLVQAGIAGLQIFFANMKLAGKSEAEKADIFRAEQIAFEYNNPDNLPDV